MKITKNVKLLLLFIVIGILVSFSVEIFLNRRVLKKNDNYSPKIIESKNIEQDGKWFKATSDRSYIVVLLKDSYMNKIRFDYNAQDDFMWNIEYNDEDVGHVSSSLINKAIRKINKDIPDKKIKIVFKGNNLKFKNISVDNRIYLNWSRILVMFIFIMGIFILVYDRQYYLNHLEKAFLFIALVGGCTIILTMPKTVFLSWDDQIHFKSSIKFLNSKSYRFSIGEKAMTLHNKMDLGKFQTIEEKMELYKSLNEMHQKTKNIKIKVSNTPTVYKKIVYLPFTIGLRIGNILGLSFIISFVLAKLLNFLCYIIMIYYAIKMSATIKKIIFLISLFISNIFLATQFSYDPTIISGIILALSIFVKLMELEKINIKLILAFIGCVVWASLPKAIYAPLLLLLLFIPNNKFNSKKQAILFKMLIIGITILLMATFIFPFLIGEVEGDIRGGDTSASKQLSLILHNPINYGILLLKFFVVRGTDYVIGVSSFSSLAYMTHYIDSVINIIYISNFILLMYVIFSDKYNKRILTNKMKIIFSIAYIGISILIVTAMYLSFTPVGSNYIDGVQPRYFMPIFLLLLLIITPTKYFDKRKERVTVQNNWLLLVIPYISIMLVSFLTTYIGVGI